MSVWVRKSAAGLPDPTHAGISKLGKLANFAIPRHYTDVCIVSREFSERVFGESGGEEVSMMTGYGTVCCISWDTKVKGALLPGSIPRRSKVCR